jgi:hypothetical protein
MGQTVSGSDCTGSAFIVHLSCGSARVVVLRAVGYWAGWLGNFLSCSMTWSRL